MNPLDWPICVQVILVLIALAGFLFFLSRHAFWKGNRPKNWPRVLMYHHIDPYKEASGMNTPPQLLEKQLQYFQKRGAKFYTMSELAEAEPHDNMVAITVDDGYEDNHRYLFPLLRKYKAKATIYYAPNLKDDRLMNELQMREMVESGLVEFGAHTMDHVNLLNVPDSIAKTQILQSKEAVEKLTGQPCTSFAYPYGRYGSAHVKILHKLGFKTACTTKKMIRPLMESPLQTPRVSTNGQASMLQFIISLMNGRYRI
ncbi:polysaccharide deacetylase family protein [Persicirhabdus sediminis]|uniref:Polysaccharide deacetylase family protein n=1 Tax=Persicirhabdus sediminis TaxID=454144 RepID=A0A8J7MCB9_9BACT|nr:polysaccharide deacetylase family protein [Persicirhabdus sediminis]MBK1790527.1 polysaccharide deacetylase family protein [Persicirhabdus sediminis]